MHFITIDGIDDRVKYSSTRRWAYHFLEGIKKVSVHVRF